ncbi:MAG: serine hydrolase domain-containing protein, partial [Bacteroidota bacterium]
QIKEIVEKCTDGKSIFGAVLSLSRGNESFTVAAGNMAPESPYFIASVTKMYVAAMILQLVEKGYIKLDDRISLYLGTDIVKKLHNYKGKDYSRRITVRQIMSHCSGLPDYFEQKREDGTSLRGNLAKGKDVSWAFEDVLSFSRNNQARFIPGHKKRAFYSDTNYQLLGKILENVSGKTLSENIRSRIAVPLGLKNTYLYENASDKSPAPIYYKKEPRFVPNAMRSFTSDGGIVSTADENRIFLRAFFEGMLFQPLFLKDMTHWRKIFFPFRYGMGIARFKLPRIFWPFSPLPELIGHPGSSGAFAYFYPGKDVYLAGTINQMSNPGLPYIMLIRALMKL